MMWWWDPPESRMPLSSVLIANAVVSLYFIYCVFAFVSQFALSLR